MLRYVMYKLNSLHPACSLSVWVRLSISFFLRCCFSAPLICFLVFPPRLWLWFVACCYLFIVIQYQYSIVLSLTVECFFVFFFCLNSFALPLCERGERPAAVLVHKNLFNNVAKDNRTCTSENLRACVYEWILLHPSKSRAVFITLDTTPARQRFIWEHTLLKICHG